MLGLDQRSVVVGTSPVTLAGVNARRRALMIGCPLGTAGAWVTIQFNGDPSLTSGMPIFFGNNPVILEASSYG